MTKRTDYTICIMQTIFRIFDTFDGALGCLATLIPLNNRTDRWRGCTVLLVLVLYGGQISWIYGTTSVKSSDLPFNALLIISTMFYILFLSGHSIDRKQARLNYFMAAGFGVF